MKFTRAIARTMAMSAIASLFHSTASAQPSSYVSTFAVNPPGAPAVDNDFEITHFGPAGCVSTWKNQASHCVIRTECKNQSLMGYNIRLMCIDSGNAAVRHVFGKGSFDPEETFDTLVVCNQCTADEEIVVPAPAPGPAPASALGMEKPVGASASFATSAQVAQLSASVQSLSTEVNELKVSMGSSIESVKKLETAVFGAGSLQGSAITPTVAIPTQAQAGSSGVAAQPPATAAPTQVQALSSGAAALPPATGRRNSFRKKHLVKQQRQQQQKELEETSPVIDETEAQKPSQQQLDAAQDLVQADDRSVMSGDIQMENKDQVEQSAADDAGSAEFAGDYADQESQNEEEPEDGMAGSGEYSQDDQE